MLTKIHNSIFTKVTALVLIAFYSFTPFPFSTVKLPAGTSVVLETMSLIRSDQVTAGQSIDFRVRQDVKIDGKVVIAAGSIAKGQVTRASKAKGIGKEGYVEITIRDVNAVDDQQVVLTGANIFNEGDDKQTLAILLGVFICLLFLLIKGENAEIASGTQINATVASNMEIQVD